MAKYTQIRDANMTTGYEGGWCLKFVQDAFRTDHPYPTAMAAWNANYGKGNHPNELPPVGKTVPVYFSLGHVPAGHVAISLDDAMIASSTQAGFHSRPYFHRNLQDLINVYGQYNGGCKYLGWSEFVGSVRVVKSDAEAIAAAAQAAAAAKAKADAIAKAKVAADAAAAQAQAAVDAAKKAADAKAQADADAKAKADAQAAADKQARDDALANQPPVVVPAPPVDYAKENNGLLIQLLNLIKRIFNIS